MMKQAAPDTDEACFLCVRYDELLDACYNHICTYS